MIRVRYPNGQSIIYEEATFLQRSQDGWNLYTDTQAINWIASIQLSAGAIVENADGKIRVTNSTPLRRKLKVKK